MILVALCLVCPGVSAVVNPKPFVIPELKEWKGAEGAFVPTETTKIVCPANQPELLRIARMLADDCETMFGHKPEVVQGKGGAGDVILAIRADKKLGKEGYTVKVTDRILLTAPESIGVYWGTRTLLQIAEQSENHQFPKGTLRDFPDYAMRGFMIGCGRKFIPLSFLQDYVKIMALNSSSGTIGRKLMQPSVWSRILIRVWLPKTAITPSMNLSIYKSWLRTFT